jgi:hypothetical protein
MARDGATAASLTSLHSAIAIRITGDMMVLETGNCVVVIARFSEHAAAVGNSA